MKRTIRVAVRMLTDGMTLPGGPPGLRTIATLLVLVVTTIVAPVRAEGPMGTDAYAWYRADALVLPNGARVNWWPDASGHGHHMQNTQPDSHITFQVEGDCSMPYVHFDGGSWMTFAGFTVSLGDYTVIAAKRITPPGGGGACSLAFSNEDGLNLYSWPIDGSGQNNTTTTAIMAQYSYGGNLVAAGYFPAHSTTQYHVFASTREAASGHHDAFFGRTQVGNDNCDGSPNQTCSPCCFSKAATAWKYFHGRCSTQPNEDIVEVILYDKVLSSTEIGSIYDYLRGKYGLDGGDCADPTGDPTNPPTPQPVLALVDPNCSAPDSCGGQFLTAAGEIPTDPADPKLVQAAVQRSRIATDGVTELLIRYRTSAHVRLELLDPGGQPAGTQYGQLRPLGGGAGAQVIPDLSPSSTPSGSFAFAIYTAPAGFPGTAAQIASGVGVKLRLTELPTGPNALVLERSLDLRQPPVVLVHGIWSSKDSWTKFGKNLAGAGYNVDLVDYAKPHSADTLDPLTSNPQGSYPIRALITTTDQLLTKVRTAGIAATQVDIVGHSMGGMVTRAREKYRLSPYYRRGNGFHGDFRKILTVGTPHLGTELADVLVQHRCDTLRYCFNNGVQVATNLQTLMGVVGKPIGPAVFEFQTGSGVLRKIGATPVPAHPVAGKAGSSVIEPLMNIFLNAFVHAGNNVDGILGGDGNHDTLVRLASQLNNSEFDPANPGTATIVPNIVHATFWGLDESETQSQQVWGELKSLLLATPTSATFPPFSAFVGGGPNVAQTACPPVSPLGTCSTSGPAGAQVQLEISPTPEPGWDVDIVFGVTGGNPISGALITVGETLYAPTGPGPYQVWYHVPDDRTGPIEIHARTYGPGPENYAATATMQVRSMQTATSLSVEPTNVTLHSIGESLKLHVEASYPVGPVLDVTEEDRTTYTTADGTCNVVCVLAGGVLEARGQGQTVVHVNHVGLSADVNVSVAITNHAPDLAWLANQSMTVGQVRLVTLAATDADGDTITLSGDQLPAFATILPGANGSGTLRLAPVSGQVGTYTMYVVATDNGVPALGDVSPITVTVTGGGGGSGKPWLQQNTE